MPQQQMKIIQDDPWLAPYEEDINSRFDRYQNKLSEFKDIVDFASAKNFFGFNYDTEKQGWYYREWAPSAHALSLIGDFNEWNDQSNPLKSIGNGVWECFLDNIKHGDKLKVRITGNNGTIDRIPAWIERAVQDPVSFDFAGQLWAPKNPFRWSDNKFDLGQIKSPLIYECHVGMAQEKEGVGTYKEFEDHILPRIKSLGYNCIQMMAVQEHPYYGSFGYHVSNFFAASSRFGSPEDLKSLINTAHNMGIAVIMDVVHSHAVKNIAEGLNDFDGSNDHYFHPGDRGNHPGWDSKLFNYGKTEVTQFLLSNLKYWLEEYHFDGFRFDGVTSMLYFHHGEISFDHYDKYFKEGVEWDAVTYLQLANKLIKEVKPNALSIAEDMSGMPGLCRPIEEGGVGFDYRLAMGIPDYWIKLFKHSSDEEWNIEEFWEVLNNRRYGEKSIAYAESHDQALVGDKSLAFWLMDKEMYFHMKKEDQNIIIERGIALHKMIRLITLSLGGEGYLTFIGNEFGHPEWVDFPRAGNDWSYKYARRQWSLVDNPNLKFEFLNNFDQAMINLIKSNEVLSQNDAEKLHVDHVNKVLIFKRGNLVFLFNFHPHNAIPDYKFFVKESGVYELLLDSDQGNFGGHHRLEIPQQFHSFAEDNVDKLRVYLPNRTALVLKRKTD